MIRLSNFLPPNLSISFFSDGCVNLRTGPVHLPAAAPTVQLCTSGLPLCVHSCLLHGHWAPGLGPSRGLCFPKGMVAFYVWLSISFFKVVQLHPRVQCSNLHIHLTKPPQSCGVHLENFNYSYLCQETSTNSNPYGLHWICEDAIHLQHG